MDLHRFDEALVSEQQRLRSEKQAHSLGLITNDACIHINVSNLLILLGRNDEAVTYLDIAQRLLRSSGRTQSTLFSTICSTAALLRKLRATPPPH